MSEFIQVFCLRILDFFKYIHILNWSDFILGTRYSNLYKSLENKHQFHWLL